MSKVVQLRKDVPAMKIRSAKVPTKQAVKEAEGLLDILTEQVVKELGICAGQMRTVRDRALYEQSILDFYMTTNEDSYQIIRPDLIDTERHVHQDVYVESQNEFVLRIVMIIIAEYKVNEEDCPKSEEEFVTLGKILRHLTFIGHVGYGPFFPWLEKVEGSYVPRPLFEEVGKNFPMDRSFRLPLWSSGNKRFTTRHPKAEQLIRAIQDKGQPLWDYIAAQENAAAEERRRAAEAERERRRQDEEARIAKENAEWEARRAQEAKWLAELQPRTTGTLRDVLNAGEGMAVAKVACGDPSMFFFVLFQVEKGEKGSTVRPITVRGGDDEFREVVRSGHRISLKACYSQEHIFPHAPDEERRKFSLTIHKAFRTGLRQQRIEEDQAARSQKK